MEKIAGKPLFLRPKFGMDFIQMRKKYFGAYKNNTKGTTAIEFALLFMPYLMLSLAIIELSLMYASASMLEGATTAAARLVRTGQVQQSNNPETMFRANLCDSTLLFINCNNINIDVLQMDSFSDFDNIAPQYDADGNMTSQGFSVGGSGDRVLVRTAARYTILTPLIGTLLGGEDSSLLFMSTIVLQTEPYDFDPDA